MAMHAGQKELQRIIRDRNNSNAKLHTETRREQYSSEAAFGGDPRPGEYSENLKEHHQTKHEERERYRADVETETHKTALQMQKLTVDVATQKRGMASLRKEGLEEHIHSVDAMEVATIFTYRSQCRVRDTVKDENLLKLLIDGTNRSLSRSIDYLATLTVGPELDLSRFDEEGLGL